MAKGCQLPAPRPRIDAPGAAFAIEWTGVDWTPVCPDCNLAMDDRDERCRLRCRQCHKLVAEIDRRK